LLELAAAHGARIWNRPRSLRDHSTRSSPSRIPAVHADHADARKADVIRAFLDELGDVVLKPLDGMGGSSVFRVRATMRTSQCDHRDADGCTAARSIMAQRYLPGDRHGDKRILLIDGVPVPYASPGSRRPARRAATWRPADAAWRSR
jgi:glutathione synthase